MRLTGAGAELTSAITSTSTSFATNGDWSTDPAAYPLELIVGGERITAAGRVGSTFTGCARSLNRVVKAHASGTSVEVAWPLRMTLGHTRRPLAAVEIPAAPATPVIVPQEPMPTISPGPGGITRTVTTVTEWNTAIAAAVAGDVIDITASITNAAGLNVTGVSGADGNPIIITSANGAVVTATPSDPSDPGCIDLQDCSHVHVIGVETNGGNYGVRLKNCHGSAANPIKISHNLCYDSKFAKLVVQDDPSYNESSYVDVEDNEVYGNDGTDIYRSEGIYVGSGDAAWVDFTHHVNVRRNYCHDLNAEGIEVKQGAEFVNVEHNYLANIDTVGSSNGPTGALAIWITGSGQTIPSSIVDANVLVAGNRLYNCSTYGHGAITFGFGGVDVIGNLIWGHDTWGIRARGFGGASGDAGNVTPNAVNDNTMIGDGYNTGATGTPSVVVTTSGNIYNGTGVGEYTYILGTDFTGPTTTTAVASGFPAGWDGDGTGFMLDPTSGAAGIGDGLTESPMTIPAGTGTHYGAMPTT